MALSFIDPAAAAAAFASAVASASAADSAADQAAVVSLRLGGVASAIAIPLSGQAELLAYARGLEALHQGDRDEAQQLLGWMGDQELRVGTVVLRPGREVLTRWRASETPPLSTSASQTTQTAAPPPIDRVEQAQAASAAPDMTAHLLINIPPAFPAERFIERRELGQVRVLLLDATPVAADVVRHPNRSDCRAGRR